MRSETDHLDMVAEIARDNAARPNPQATMFGPKVSLGQHVEALSESPARLGPQADLTVQQLRPGEFVDKESGEVKSFFGQPIRSRLLDKKKQGAGR